MKKIFTFILLCFSLLSLSYGTLGSNLLSCYSFEGNGNDVTRVYNITINGAPTSVSGKIGNTYNFSSATKFASRTAVPIGTGVSPFSINQWEMVESIYLSSVGGFFTNKLYMSYSDSTTYRRWYHYNSTGALTFNQYNSNFVNRWVMLTYVWTGSRLNLYYNGTLVYNGTTSFSSTGLTNMYIGGDGASSSLMGRIDEVGFWNRALSKSEVTYLYNSTNAISCSKIYALNLPPSFTSLKTQKGTLVNNSFFNTTTINFNVTTSLTTNKKYTLTYFSNGTFISSGLMTGSSFSSYKNLTVGIGKFKIYFNASNFNDNVKTVNYTFTIDTTLPTITNNMPVGDWYNYTLKPLKNRFVMCTDTNLLWCNISTDTFNKNVTITNNITYITNGNKTYTLRAVDRAGNSLSTTGTFRINPYQYFRFYDNLRSIYTSAFIVTNNSHIYSSVGNYVKIPIFDLGYGTHQLYYNKTGYQTTLFTTTFNTISKLNTTTNVNPVRLLLKVYSETSPTTQIRFNITIQNSTTSTQYLNQMNFSKYYNGTLHGDLTLTVSSIGYGARKLYITLLPNTVSNNTMYLLRAGASNYPIIFRALQGSGGSASTIPLEDVVLSFYRTISGTRTFLGQAQTDNNGYTYFNMNYTLGDYEVIFQKTGFITETLLTLPNVQEYTIYMVVEATEVVNNLEDFDYAFYPSSSFVVSPFIGGVTLTAANNDLSSWRFKVTGNSSINYVSTASNGGSVYYNITNKSPTYTFNLTIVKNGVTYSFIKVYNNNNLSYTNSTNLIVVAQNLNSGNYNGEKIMIILFVYIIFVGLGIFLSAGNQAVGLIIGILPLTMFMVVDWVTIPLYSILMLVTILGAYATRGGN